jgi:hypothetical protein
MSKDSMTLQIGQLQFEKSRDLPRCLYRSVPLSKAIDKITPHWTSERASTLLLLMRAVRDVKVAQATGKDELTW